MQTLGSTHRPWLQLAGCLAVTGAIGCSESGEVLVRLSSSVPQLNLTTGDTLVIERTIHNDRTDTVWLVISSSAAAFTATGPDGKASCTLGSTNADLGFQPIAGRGSVTVQRSYPIERLVNCGPGTHRLWVIADLVETLDGRAFLLSDGERPLTIR